MLKFIRNLSLSWRAETGFNLVRTFTGLEYEQNGQPEDVLRFGKRNDQEPGPGELLVDWLAVNTSVDGRSWAAFGLLGIFKQAYTEHL